MQLKNTSFGFCDFLCLFLGLDWKFRYYCCTELLLDLPFVLRIFWIPKYDASPLVRRGVSPILDIHPSDSLRPPKPRGVN